MPRRRRTLIPLGLILAAGVPACMMVGSGGDEFRDEDAEVRTVTARGVAARVIDARDIRGHVGFLASDQMLGRDTPSPELERAASWIAARFAELGLVAAGQDGGYVHFWEYGDAQVPNVVGLVPGGDGARAGEYVVITAHFDHVGVGRPDDRGDSIYNGADDNASGVSAMLEIAEAFAALPARVARPVLFVATSGEEKGLRGARAFVADPTVFLSDAVAVLNLDMVGRNSPDSVGLVGHDYSTLGPLLLRAAAEHEALGLSIDLDPAPGQDLFARSDHYAFAARGIPAIAVTSGLHEHYHRPGDEPARIDADKVARVARLVFLAAHRLAAGEDAEWTEAGRRALQQER